MMNLTVLTHPTEEIVSLEEAKNYLHVDHDFDDNLINIFIKTARMTIESIIQKSILYQTLKYEITTKPVYYKQQNHHSNLLKNLVKICLPKPPIIKITQLKINENFIDETLYNLEKINNKYYISINCNKIISTNIPSNFEITYKAGMAENNCKIDERLKLATLITVANMYQDRFENSNENIISNGIKQLLFPFLEINII